MSDGNGVVSVVMCCARSYTFFLVFAYGERTRRVAFFVFLFSSIQILYYFFLMCKFFLRYDLVFLCEMTYAESVLRFVKKSSE